MGDSGQLRAAPSSRISPLESAAQFCSEDCAAIMHKIGVCELVQVVDEWIYVDYWLSLKEEWVQVLKKPDLHIIIRLFCLNYWMKVSCIFYHACHRVAKLCSWKFSFIN